MCKRFVVGGMAAAFAAVLALVPTLGAPQINSGLVAAEPGASEWRHVAFSPPFTDAPIVLMGGAADSARAPAGIRVANITPDGFDFLLEQPASASDHDNPQWVSYLAVEPGVFSVADGVWQALRVSDVTSAFTQVPWDGRGDRPIVFSQIVTANNRQSTPEGDSLPQLRTILHDVSPAGGQLALQPEQEGAQPLVGEEVCLLVVSPGRGTVGSSPFSASLFAGADLDDWFPLKLPQTFDGALVLAQTQTFRSPLLDPADPACRNQLTVDPTQGVGLFLFGRDDGHSFANDTREAESAKGSQKPSASVRKPLVSVARSLLPGGTLNLAVEVAEAFEKGGQAARVRIVRADAFGLVTVGFTVAGSDDPAKASASPNDYVIRDGSGNALAGSVEFPAGAAELVFTIHPVVDSRDEAPETLVVSLTPSADYTVGTEASANLRIYDADNSPENDRLFLAYLTPQDGARTSGSGVATLRLRGDNAAATLTVTFGGLTTPESAAHIHLAIPGLGETIAESLPLGQIPNHFWTIRPVAPITATEQEALDALFAGQYYVNVHTEKHPVGEIRGDLRRQTGSTELQIPAPPPPLELLSAADLDRDIARFLTQATFGPTTNLMQEVKDLINDPAVGNGDRIAGMSAWIDRQMNPSITPQASLLKLVLAADAQEFWVYTNDPTASYYKPTYGPSYSNRRRAWWPLVIRANDHLRQKVTFALSEIFVVSEIDNTVSRRHYGAADYYDTLGKHAFGSFRSLLFDVSVHPIMGAYLSHLRNQRQIVDSAGRVLVSPDENYARELKQLFTIGLLRLHDDGSVKLDSSGMPIPTFNEDSVVDLARVLTGWSFSVRNSASAPNVVNNTDFHLTGGSSLYHQAQWMHPMKMFPSYHDTGSKTILFDVVIPAGQTGEADLNQALDVLANHPNTAPFIVRRLIQRLVTSNPSPGYIYRVAQVWRQANGNLGPVIKAILLDYEARSLRMLEEVSFGKQKEPIIRYVATLRALGAASLMPLSDLLAFGYPSEELAKFPPGSTVYRYPDMDVALGQSPLRAPSVFNWFLPDYAVEGPTSAAGLVAPEFQITTENQVINAINTHYTISYPAAGEVINARLPIYTTVADDVKPNYSPLLTLYSSTLLSTGSPREAVTRIVDWLDQLLCAGSLKATYANAPTPNPRSTIIDTVLTVGSGTGTTGTRIRTATYLVLCTPEFIIQK